MPEPLVFSGSEPSGRTVTFSHLEQPHGDSLTWLRVDLAGEGLAAACSTESLDGDDGLDLDSETKSGEGTRVESVRLSHLFVELGSGARWEGDRRWRSLGGELAIDLAVDRTGHVDVTFRLAPRPWEATWSASVVLRYALGDLISAGHDLDRWVQAQILR
jgi:hypothetical protein